MTMRLQNVFHDRVVEIEGTHRSLPNSVFIADEAHGFCIEIDKAEFIAAVKKEFGLLEPLEIGVERFLASV